MAGVTTLPDLTSQSPDQLGALCEQIQASAAKLADAAANGDDNALADIETLRDNYKAVQQELAARDAATADRAARVNEALAEIQGDAPDDGSDDGSDDAPDPATAGDGNSDDGSDDGTPDADAAAAEDAQDGGADDATENPDGTPIDPDNGAAKRKLIPAPVAAAAVEEPAEATTDTVDAEGIESKTDSIPHPADLAAVGSTSSSDQTHEEAAVADNTPTTEDPAPAGGDLAALATERPTASAPVVLADRPAPGSRSRTREVARFHDLGIVDSNTRDHEVSSGGLASLIVRQHQQFQGLGRSNIERQPVILAHAATEWDRSEMLGSGHEENFGIIERAVGQAEALVASGGNCAPLAPNYDVFNVAEAQSPVEDALPTVGAPRGGIRYIQPPSWPEAVPGVAITTVAQDAAGYTNQNPAGTTAPKPCVHLACRSIVECSVEAVSQCVTFGNLQYRTFPEQVDVFLAHLAVAFAQAKEVSYLSTISAGSTQVSAQPDYGAVRSTVFAFALAAHGYRKRNHMPVDAVLDVLAPDTLIPMLKVDMVQDLHMGLGFLSADEFTVANELFQALHLNVSFYYDYTAGFGALPALQQSQVQGPLNPFPQALQAFLFSPGTWIRLDGGTLDVGIVRDSTLNSTNDLQIFAEEWTQVCKVGVESVELDLSLCVNGTGPSPVTAHACSS